MNWRVEQEADMQEQFKDVTCGVLFASGKQHVLDHCNISYIFTSILI
jgi:hypothetical protein